MLQSTQLFAGLFPAQGCLVDRFRMLLIGEDAESTLSRSGMWIGGDQT
jgi:hypothetical protein